MKFEMGVVFTHSTDAPTAFDGRENWLLFDNFEVYIIYLATIFDKVVNGTLYCGMSNSERTFIVALHTR